MLDFKDSFFLIYYEDLISDKRKTIKSILDFLKLTEDINIDELIGKTDRGYMKNKSPQHIRKGIIGDWKHYFDNKHESIYREHTNNIINKLNYHSYY